MKYYFCILIVWLIVFSVPPSGLAADTFYAKRHAISSTTKEKKDKENSFSHLQKWIVQDESDKIQKALEIYKNKSKPAYSKKYWIINNQTGQKSILVEYMASSPGDQIIFSPNEHYAYFVGLTPLGQHMIYGINLSNQNQFTVDQGESASIFSCEDSNQSYLVIVHENGKITRSVYYLNGQKKDVIEDGVTAENLKDYVCY